MCKWVVLWFEKAVVWIQVHWTFIFSFTDDTVLNINWKSHEIFFSPTALNLIKCMKDSELLSVLNYTTYSLVLGFFELKSVEVVWLRTGSLDALAYPYLLLTKVWFELSNTEPAFIGCDSVSDTWSGKCLCTDFKLWLYICFYWSLLYVVLLLFYYWIPDSLCFLGSLSNSLWEKWKSQVTMYHFSTVELTVMMLALRFKTI